MRSSTTSYTNTVAQLAGSIGPPVADSRSLIVLSLPRSFGVNCSVSAITRTVMPLKEYTTAGNVSLATRRNRYVPAISAGLSDSLQPNVRTTHGRMPSRLNTLINNKYPWAVGEVTTVQASFVAWPLHHQPWRSEERRVGKECRSGWSPDHSKKKIAL